MRRRSTCGILGVLPIQEGRSHLMRSLRQVDPAVHWSHEATLDALSQTVQSDQIERILLRVGRLGQRTRKLTTVLAVLLCIAMNLFTEEAQDDVLDRLMRGPRFLRPEDDLKAATKGAIAQRRQQVGVAPVAALFREVCQPLATPATRDAFLFGFRLMLVDGTTEELADTPANAAYFGRPTSSRGAGAFPQVRAVYLCEAGTHAICDAGFWPYPVSERVGGLRLLRSVGRGMLVLWDRGFHSYDMCARCRQRGAHFLARVRSDIQLNPLRQLSDGSYLAQLLPSDSKRRRRGEHRLVRVIEYTIDDPARPGHGERHRVITSLLNPVLYPAQALAVAYHERWEVEVTIDETDTHQRVPRRPLRSRTPTGVLQELYGLLLAHYAIRAVMHEAAVQAEVAPDRLSFVKAVRLLRSAVIEGQIVAEAQRPAWRARLLREIARHQLPARDGRCNPRVVRRKMSNFDVKRDKHRHWPQPTKPFDQAVVICAENRI